MFGHTYRTHSRCRKKRDPRSALIRVAVLALAFFAGSNSVSMADDSGVPADARLTQSTKKPAAGGTEATGGATPKKTAGAVDQGPTKPVHPLTIQQKRIFVLGLGTSEKN